MVGFPDFGTVPFSWFVVLPDRASAGSVARTLSECAAQHVTHESGRSWLLGRWSPGEVSIGQRGSVKIAMLGQHAVTADELSAAAGRVRNVADLDRLAGSTVGSSHLIASVAGRVRAQGTVTGLRRLFHADCDGVPVAADRADVLAWLLGAELDADRLAAHLLDPPILYPIAGHPVWRGVKEVSTDCYLQLDEREDRQHTVRWWSPPDPVVPMAEGAAALRDALGTAVDARARGRELVSCDLGGLDSTAVCCLAARGPAKVVAFTADSQDPLADDVYWSRRTAEGLGNLEHHVIPAAEMPLVYHRILETEDQLDEPCAAAVDRERWLIIGRSAGARGSRLHFTGFGGDELLYGSLAHLHTLMRSHPLQARRLLRGFAAKYRWPRTRMLRQLLDNTSYRAWLTRVAARVTAPPPPLEDPLLDWGFEPRLPPWASPAAIDAVRRLISAEADAGRPFAEIRGQHRELETMRFVSRMGRQFGQMATRFGISLAAPYYDDRVLEAGLAVRPQERLSPWRYKPLILEAMRGIVPEASLVRQTKANGTCDEDTGLRRNRADLLALWEDSRLGRLGLVDASALREMCRRPLPAHLQIGVLYQTVACEMWLRALEGAPVTTN